MPTAIDARSRICNDCISNLTSHITLHHTTHVVSHTTQDVREQMDTGDSVYSTPVHRDEIGDLVLERQF